MSNDPLDLDAQAQREKTEKEWATIRRVRDAESFAWIMSDERGRRFIWGILERSGLFSLNYDGTGESAIRAIEATSEARLMLGLLMAFNPLAFGKMILERENDDGPKHE